MAILRKSGGGARKKHSGWLLPAAVFLVTACLSALVLAYYVVPDAPRLIEEQPAPTDATRPVALTIGTTRFRIPSNYILLASARRGGTMQKVALVGLLPDLRGYMLTAAQELTGNAPDSRVVNLMLKAGEPVLPEQERLSRIYMAQVENPKGQPGPYGLRQYKFRADSGYHDQDLFLGQGDTGPVVLLCTKLTPEIPPPSCLRDAPLTDGVSLSYRFKRAHLAQWRDIDMRIRELIAGFRETD
jgi:hypothetical protein